jgi:hypothetical protein
VTGSENFVVNTPVDSDSPLYVGRVADERLLSLCRAGRSGIVLGGRRMGKTSLFQHARKILQTQGISTAYVDLASFYDCPQELDHWLRWI